MTLRTIALGYRVEAHLNFFMKYLLKNIKIIQIFIYGLSMRDM